MTPVTWSRAWRDAARGFWAREEPGGHFTTSASALVADRLAAIVHEVDTRLGHPRSLAIVDIGCGDGHLLSLVRERCDGLGARARWIGVDLRPVRIDGVESVVAESPCDLAGAPWTGVVMAHEWLDEIPCDVVERDARGVDRVVLVGCDGVEMLGPSIDDDDACRSVGVDAARVRAWLRLWWPLREPGDRAEIGGPRDRAWCWMTDLVGAGTAIATDYGHVRAERDALHHHGTLSAYHAGRLTRPIPDGSMNLTAHVAVDSCAAARRGTSITLQRDEVPSSPFGQGDSVADVERYFAALRLRDPARLGGVAWLRWDA
jgi:SAM-dependent MidA family methyltransferase